MFLHPDFWFSLACLDLGCNLPSLTSWANSSFWYMVMHFVPNLLFLSQETLYYNSPCFMPFLHILLNMCWCRYYNDIELLPLGISIALQISWGRSCGLHFFSLYVFWMFMISSMVPSLESNNFSIENMDYVFYNVPVHLLFSNYISLYKSTQTHIIYMHICMNRFLWFDIMVCV